MAAVLAVVIAAVAAEVSAQRASAESAVLRGRVIDGASVRVLGRSAVVMTDQSGRFVLADIPPGVVSVHVERLGYRSALEAEVLLQISRSTYVEFRFERQAIELEGLSVGAEALSGTRCRAGLRDGPVVRGVTTYARWTARRLSNTSVRIGKPKILSSGTHCLREARSSPFKAHLGLG